MVYIEKDFPIESIDRIAWSESNARKPIYHIHKWFARRVGSTFRAIILGSFLEENPMDYYYDQIKVKSKEGKPPIIIDPFMGGGTTIIEGHRLGCKMIGVDVNPLAWYITKMELTPSSVKNVNEEYKRIQEEIKVKITSYYRTTCNEGHDSDVMYVFWIKMVDCENCKKEIQLLKSLILAKLNPSEWVYLCPSCGNVFWSEGDRSKVTCSSCNSVFNPNSAIAKKRTYTCPLCTYDGDILKAFQQKNNQPPLQMIAIEYYCQINC